VPWRVPLTQQQLARLLAGFVPNDMDDKWLVRVLPPDAADGSARVHNATVWFLRSWTGYMVAELAVEISNSGDGSAARAASAASAASAPGAAGATDAAGAAGAGATSGNDGGGAADEGRGAAAGHIVSLTWMPSHPEGDDVDTVKETVRRVCTWVIGFDLGPEEVVASGADEGAGGRQS
jgi:hypothetical protein